MTIISVTNLLSPMYHKPFSIYGYNVFYKIFINFVVNIHSYNTLELHWKDILLNSVLHKQKLLSEAAWSSHGSPKGLVIKSHDR